MRGLSWLLALVGVAQFGIVAYARPDGLSVDMAYLVMALFVLAAAALWACSWMCGCGWDSGCGCGHCDGCSGGECCGHCGCEGEVPHAHDANGHAGHSH